MDKVLVTYASRIGATTEVAHVVGEQLSRAGLDVDVRPVQQARDARLYSAVIIGSSIYFRHWDKDAVRYLRAQAPDLAERPVWLFQTGAHRDDAQQEQFVPPSMIRRLIADIGIENPVVVFDGDPDRARGRLAKWVTNSSISGDSRGFLHIRTWATDIAHELLEASSGGSAPLNRSVFDSAST